MLRSFFFLVCFLFWDLWRHLDYVLYEYWILIKMCENCPWRKVLWHLLGRRETCFYWAFDYKLSKRNKKEWNKNRIPRLDSDAIFPWLQVWAEWCFFLFYLLPTLQLVKIHDEPLFCEHVISYLYSFIHTPFILI